jgi:hypothetical protein
MAASRHDLTTPYDYTVDLEAERFWEEQACRAHALWCERRRRERLRKMAWFAVLFSLACLVIGFFGACL